MQPRAAPQPFGAQGDGILTSVHDWHHFVFRLEGGLQQVVHVKERPGGPDLEDWVAGLLDHARSAMVAEHAPDGRQWGGKSAVLNEFDRGGGGDLADGNVIDEHFAFFQQAHA